MPSFSYTIDVLNGVEQTLIHIIMIDTIVLCGNVPFPPLGYPGTEPGDAGAKAWLDFESELAKAAATSVPYILVVGHYPVWSVAKHGPNKCLVQSLQPLLHKYNVSLYLSGHDHNQQFFTEPNSKNKVSYALTGCAMDLDVNTPNLNRNNASLLFHWPDSNSKTVASDGGMLVAQADSTGLILSFYSTTFDNQLGGEALYVTVIAPRNL